MSDTDETPNEDVGVAPVPAFPEPDLEVEAGVADPGPATDAGDAPDEVEAEREAKREADREPEPDDDDE